jgi:hypothetical protein
MTTKEDKSDSKGLIIRDKSNLDEDEFGQEFS